MDVLYMDTLCDEFIDAKEQTDKSWSTKNSL